MRCCYHKYLYYLFDGTFLKLNISLISYLQALYPPNYSVSVGSSPIHRPTTPELRRPSSPNPFGKRPPKPDHPNGSLESSSPSKPGLFKKLFTRGKNKQTPTQSTPTHDTSKLNVSYLLLSKYQVVSFTTC